MLLEKSLIIIDAQVNMFDEQMPIYNADHLLLTLTNLVEQARQADIPIIFVRNNGTTGDPDEPGTPGWEIHPALPRQANDLIVDKHTPDSFDNTNLQAALQTKGVNQLIVAGMQTEICVHATCQRAKALGYDVTVVADAHSTFDMDDVTAAQVIEQFNASLKTIAQIKLAHEIVF